MPVNLINYERLNTVVNDVLIKSKETATSSCPFKDSTLSEGSKLETVCKIFAEIGNLEEKLNKQKLLIFVLALLNSEEWPIGAALATALSREQNNAELKAQKNTSVMQALPGIDEVLDDCGNCSVSPVPREVRRQLDGKLVSYNEALNKAAFEFGGIFDLLKWIELSTTPVVFADDSEPASTNPKRVIIELVKQELMDNFGLEDEAINHEVATIIALMNGIDDAKQVEHDSAG